jgi:proteasome beta subunit
MDAELKNNILKTGTTILGIACKDGIIMAGDRQVTGGGSVVMQKDFKKVNQINDYLVVSWTGGVADALMSTKLINAELRLKELKSKKRPTIKEAANLVAMITFRNIRQPSMIPSIVGTLIAGFNEDGTTELYSIEPAGGVYQVKDYDANFGSGMPYVLGVLESGYKENLLVKEGKELAIKALKASTQRDVGSGHGIDVFEITKEGINHVVEQKILPEYKNIK